MRGYTIPKDTIILPHLDGVLLSEAVWGDPQVFRPERFIDNKGNLLNPDELVPFSMGVYFLCAIQLLTSFKRAILNLLQLIIVSIFNQKKFPRAPLLSSVSGHNLVAHTALAISFSFL